MTPAGTELERIAVLESSVTDIRRDIQDLTANVGKLTDSLNAAVLSLTQQNVKRVSQPMAALLALLSSGCVGLGVALVSTV